jgi:hypothetical protein
MKIFVGYGYNARDAWIEDLVFRLIRAFNDEATHGKVTFGGTLDSVVNEEILASDALIGFRTRRDPSGVAGVWTTHEWVDDELLAAANHPKGIPFVEVRETLVKEPGGILQQKLHGRQYINYDEKTPERCLVDIAQALGRWHRQRSTVQFIMMPDEFCTAVSPVLKDRDLRCVYRVLGEADTEPGPEKNAFIGKLPTRQIVVRTGAVPEDASIMIEIWMGKTRLLWSSDWQPVNSRTIHLEKA